MLESGLSLHGKLAPTPVRPLHTRLLERFATMRNTVHQANIETSNAMLWAPCNISSSVCRPSILSQPLPPIPNSQRQDTSSDPETSSLSSSSSATQSNLVIGIEKVCYKKTSTPPLTQIPPPLNACFHMQSPSKLIKSKPLPPLPPSDDSSMLNNGLNANKSTPSSPQLQRISSTISTMEHLKQSKMFPTDDNIYSVPQVADLIMNLNDLENESSVDDSLDYFDISAEQTNGESMDSSANSKSIYRSRSIPRSSISLYNGGQPINGQPNSTETDEIDCAPPPLPPRSTTLDRSNSLNSGIKSNMVPSLVPPALPQRPVRKSSSTVNSAQPNGGINQSNTFTSIAKPLEDNSYFDEIEFENLVISSPTPRSESSVQPSRPAPIIGIEIDSNENLLQTSMFADSFLDSAKIHEHRNKSSSLPRMQPVSLNFDNCATTSTNETKSNENTNSSLE